MNSLTYLKSIKLSSYTKNFYKKRGLCEACGTDTVFIYHDVVNDRLAREWSINKKLQKSFSARESMHCSKCHCSARSRAHAKALLLTLGLEDGSLEEAISANHLKGKKIAEINACGDLHNILVKIEGLTYSEYGPRAIDVPEQDLQNLTYNDDSFDIVLTSDTLEHVPDYGAALSEIYRVLLPGGYHIFTVPIIFSRKTRRRIKIEGDSITPTMEESYHGAGESDNLVCTEFGINFLDDLKKVGFETEVYFASYVNKNEVNCVLVSRKGKG